MARRSSMFTQSGSPAPNGSHGVRCRAARNPFSEAPSNGTHPAPSAPPSPDSGPANNGNSPSSERTYIGPGEWAAMTSPSPLNRAGVRGETIAPDARTRKALEEILGLTPREWRALVARLIKRGLVHRPASALLHCGGPDEPLPEIFPESGPSCHFPRRRFNPVSLR
jgi:hypothetical protein